MDLNSKVQIQNYIKLFYSKRWIILSFAVLGAIGSILYLKFTKPEYSSTTTIIIEKNSSGINNSDMLFSSNLEYDLQNHLQHLKSYKISKLVFKYISERKDEYPFEFEIFKEENLEKFGSDRAKISWLKGKLNVNRIELLADLIGISFTSHDPVEAAEIANIYQKVYIQESLNYVETELVSLKKYLIDKIYEKEKLLIESEDNVNVFMQQENIKSLGEQTRESINTIANINAKKAEYQIELEGALESKKAIEQQIATNNATLTNFDADVGINTSFYRTLTENIATKKAQKLKMEARLENLNLSRDTFQDKFDQLQNEIEVLEEQLAEQTKLKTTGTSVEGSVKLAEDLRNRYLGLDIQIKSLQKSIFTIDEFLVSNKLSGLNLPDKQLQLARLEREVAKHKKISGMLIDKLEETEIRISSRKNNVKLIDSALPNYSQIHPKKAIVVFGGVFGSLFFVTGLIFLLEYLDNTVKTEEEIDFFELNKLGMIPNINIEENESKLANQKDNFNQMEARLVTHINPHSMVAESYKSLRTNLSFQLKRNKDHKSFLISSCGPREGKSTTASNLAISFANQGKKVVLIDTDLRKPVIHSIFGLEKFNGFVEVIMNDIDLSEAYKQTSVDNLFVVTSGSIPPNPSELLSLDKIDEIIVQLKNDFDVIIFDTPPIIAVTDAAILAEKVNSSILVIRANVTDRDMVLEAKKKLSTNNDNLVGCILNDFNLERQYGYRYQYYNYYHNPKESKAKAIG